MDLFVNEIPPHCLPRDLELILTGPLNDCKIGCFHIEKPPNKPFAFVTVPEVKAGETFLNLYGLPHRAPRHQLAQRRIHYAGSFVRITKSKNQPSDVTLLHLKHEATKLITPLPTKPKNAQNAALNTLATSMLQVGSWESAKESRLRSDPKLFFRSHLTDFRPGEVVFGLKQARILLGTKDSVRIRIDIPYHHCRDIVIGTYEEPCVSFTLNILPKIYEQDPREVDLTRQLFHLSLVEDRPPAPAPLPKKVRLQGINPNHARIAGMCLVYRVALGESRQLSAVRGLLNKTTKPCSIRALKTRAEPATEFLEDTFNRLEYELSDTKRYGAHPFKLRYQIHRLARNAILAPDEVINLLPRIIGIYKTHGLDATISGMRRFARDMELPGPDDEAQDFSTRALEEALEGCVAAYEISAPDNPYELAKRHTHIMLVHKVIVTPLAIRLEGPEPEPTNRVLRKHTDISDHFIRVIFLDEDGSPVSHDSLSNQEAIFRERYKKVLDTSILICGQGYSYLGFSHSSLRSRSCWFMRPFVDKTGGLMFAEHVLRQLGDFSHIRIPAKCAARIGQNFTDTNSTVQLEERDVLELPMIVREDNFGIDRDFADGSGTISRDLLREVWRVYGSKRLIRPTVLQIRFQGAKGMVALDPRLRGRRLMIRQNMKKYETASSWDLEICGAGFRPLPMVLNRQFVKILEDLGIPGNVFMDLQTLAMKHLREMNASAINTSTFLEHGENTRSTQMPKLIRYLGQLGLEYHADQFLYSVVEIAVVSELRDLKYRARIPVEQGVTLYGLPDEYGILRENQIFVITEKGPNGGRSVLRRNNVVITRSPALHPGDVQVVDAVTVSDDHPLMQLRNCVVFSREGTRDLPSQLSGGDLDGDLYNIIWDERLVPRSTFPAANYERVTPISLDREVTRQDMSDFFVTFMETDQLGMISNRHLQLADQRKAGTLDPDCIKLAGMASTAVDYSKTGIPVRKDQLNSIKNPRFKPDFMAPDPRVVVSGNAGIVDFEDEDQDEDEAFDGIDSERPRLRYYASEKILGLLYRAIDERQFLAKMKSDHRSVASPANKQPLMLQLLKYVKQIAAQYGVLWAHHKDFAAVIRNSYEDSLTNIMYDYEPSPHHPLSEAEVFAGQILGCQGGARGKPLRDLSKIMREHFETVVEHTVLRITKGDEAMRKAEYLDDLLELEDITRDDRELEALPRAIACLDVGISQPGYEDRKLGELKSFQYVAAGVCLRELDRYRVTTFGSYSGLPRAF